MQQRVFFTGNGSGGVRPVSARRTRKPLAALLLLAAMFFMPNAAMATITGAGTSANPYTINNYDDWYNFCVNYINKDQRNKGCYWKLTADINVGSITCGFFDIEFEGRFDGGGHTITMNSLNFENSDHIGLFRATYSDPSWPVIIQNLNVVASNVNGRNYSGALIGTARGSLMLRNVYVTQGGTSRKTGLRNGGMIGWLVPSNVTRNHTVSITNCSYINTGQLRFENNTAYADAGGFVGRIEPGYSSITFTDVLVHLNSVYLNTVTNPYGGIIASTDNNVTLIRCVQTGNPVALSVNGRRGAVIGYVSNGSTITSKGIYGYAHPGKTGTTGAWAGSSYVAQAVWSAERVHTLLERRNNNDAVIASNAAGNHRWMYNDVTKRPEQDMYGNHVVKIMTGSGVAGIYNRDINTGKNLYYEYDGKGGHYGPASANWLCQPKPAPNSHQRAEFTFTKAYPGDATQWMSGKDLILATAVDGTVSAKIINVPYPRYNNTDNTANVELLPFDNKIRILWQYNNPSNLPNTNKGFYVYYRKNGATAYTRSAVINTANGNNQQASFEIPLNGNNYSDFNTTYDIVVAYVEGTPSADPAAIAAANKATINKFSTKPVLDWSVTATGGSNTITVDMNNIDNRFTNAPEFSYKIQHKANAESYADLAGFTNQSFSGNTTYSHTHTGVTTSCDGHTYKVIISAFGTTFEKETEETHITGSTNFLASEPFKASKGEHAGYVRLQWRVNREVVGGTPDAYTIFRRTANSAEEWQEMETVNSTAGTVYWSDNNVLTGIFYEYKVVLYQNCSSELKQLDEKTDIGFTQAFGIVSGRVTYGTSGSAVQGVNMLVRRNDLQNNESQYYSLKSVGGGQKFEWLANTDYFNTIWTSENWTLQFWVNSDGQNTGDEIIGYIGSTAIRAKEAADGYQVYTGFDASAVSEIIYANKFWHITLTRSGDEMKIYTVMDVNPDSIYLKNTAFACTDAATLPAADAKISFGHDLKGNIDDIRFWNKALTEAEILNTYSRMLVGNESGLKGYWTFDENLPSYAFDRSRAGTVYNSHHATTNALQFEPLVPDDKYQLALKATTDPNGNYQISGISYQGEGTSYSIVPSMGVHRFNPTEQLRYVSPQSMVHNATDFTDISSFMLRGQVVFEGGNYPVADCQFEIDGKTATQANGQPVVSDYSGNYELSIPIGQHSVRIVKTGHSFAGDGYLKDENGLDYVWNAPKANVDFQDQTKVKLIGRITGGNAEDSKPLGFGESKNNIGVETITLQTTREAYDFASTSVSETYSHNNGQWTKPNSLADDATTVDYNQKNIVVHVSPATGEFSAMVYPVPYNIQPVSVTQGDGQPVLEIKTGAENIDLTATPVPDASYLQIETRTWTDSTFITGRPGVVDHWEHNEHTDTVRYNMKWTYKYQSMPTFGMKQVVNEEEVDYLGETSFVIVGENGNPNDTIDLYNPDDKTYLFEKPVFQQGKSYHLRFNAYEEYTNYVSDPAVTVTYPINGGTVNLTNNLQITAQPEALSLDSTGMLNYRFTAGAPNLTTATGDIYATLALGAVSYEWQLGNTAIEAWQLGEKSTGTNFMTAGPDQLSAILRDPPGSASSAYIEKGTTHTSVSTTSTGNTTAADMNLTTDLGAKLTTFVGLGAGIITETEVKNDVVAGLATEQTYSTDNESSTSTTFTERFSTSDSPDFVGANGDVFIGNSTNILYGLTNGVKIQKGAIAGTEYKAVGDYKIASSAALAYGQEFATRFAFTAYELENIMIPKWQQSIAARLLPVGTAEPNPASITSPVYISKLAASDPNFGKWNLDKATFGSNPAFDLQKPYDGASYKIYFPAGWTPTSEQMKNFQDSVLWANNQIGMWEAVLAQNEKEKVEMTHKGNYSFGGGATIEYSESTTGTSSYTHNFGFNITPSLGVVTGGEVMGIGMELETSVAVTVEAGSSTGGSTDTTKTTGFILAEDGSSDELTVDYGYTASGTFAFKTRGGQTGCPYEDAVYSKYYEPGQHTLQEATMQIEVPVINVTGASTMLNVPANRPATFTLALQNESEIGEDVWFELIVDDASNPNGAELKIDGGAIGNGRLFLVKAGETLNKTLVLGKGTVDNYENIALILRSQCQGDPTDIWDVIADTAWVSAQFIPACSDVTIFSPVNNFIVNTESEQGDTLAVTIQNFDVNFPNFGYVRLEQRRVGTPDYVTVRTFYPTNLYNHSTNTDGTKEDIGSRAAIVYNWKMPDADGQYEIRATTASVNINNDEIVGEPLSTYSTTAITGYKDMTKPQALGAPSPANGIYGAGDELSVTFNEEIQTSMVIADNFTVTYDDNIEVPITFVTSANKITFEYPQDYFSILEGKTIRIEVRDIYDMRGNKSEPIVWSALVNRNTLVWDTDEIILIKEAGKMLSFTAKIRNAGNGTVSYSFTDANLDMQLPQWLSVNQPTGTLQPLQTKELTFTVSAGVNLGTYSEQIGVTSGNLIGKYISLNLTVTGKQPEWEVDPANYESTMTITGRIQIEGVYQNDAADVLAAFIGDECVGKTSPIIPTDGSSQHYTFLTVYGNSAHAGQSIKFKIWDAGTGNVYAVVTPQNLTFAVNAMHGTSASPILHNAQPVVEQSITLNNGWSWISANVVNSNPSILQQFKDRIGSAGEMLKGQNGYIQASAWTGTLSSIEKEQMYLVKTGAETTLRFDGTPAAPAGSPITLATGWNWMGYIPQFTLPVNEALTNLTAQANDQIKGQTSYRVYAGAEIGWVGNLNYLRSGEGYMYNSGAAANKTFHYPSNTSQIYNVPPRALAQQQAETVEPHWTADIYKYSSTMTMTSIVLGDGIELQSDLIEIAAFDNNGECRGSIMLQNVPQIIEHPYLGFLMVFGENSDNLTLKVYDHATGKEYTATNAVTFAPDAIHGTPTEPYRIQYTGNGTGIDETGIETLITVYPNPVKDVLHIESGALSIENVEIVNVSGKTLYKFNDAENRINVSTLPSGIYFIKIETNEGVVTRKFVKE